MSAAVHKINREDHLVAGFAALAISIHVLESAVPMLLPGVKPGLANVVVLLVLLRYGFRMAAAVSLLRVLVGSIFIGTFLTPTFFLSLGGALASLATLGVLWKVAADHIGPLGYGIAMAMAHMAGQFLLAWVAFVPHPALLNLLPILLAVAMGLGAVTGILCGVVITRLAPLEPGS